MDKETAKHRGLLHPTNHGMKRRAFWHDYRHPGLYMITLVVEGRRPLLGRLSIHPTPRIDLSPLGKSILLEERPKINRFYPNVEVWRLCIMPDHLHMILRVSDWLQEGKHLGSVVAGFKYGCSMAYRQLCGERVAPLFEQGYNDRLLFEGEQLERWKHYLDDNPRKCCARQ